MGNMTTDMDMDMGTDMDLDTDMDMDMAVIMAAMDTMVATMVVTMLVSMVDMDTMTVTTTENLWTVSIVHVLGQTFFKIRLCLWKYYFTLFFRCRS